MKRRRIGVASGVVAIILAATLVARAITFGEPDVNNRFPNAGAIVVTAGLPGAPYVVGSGVLVHPRVLLTAGHVTASGEEALAQGVPLFDISRISFGTDAFDPSTWVEGVAIVSHPDFGSPPDFPDLGVIILKEPVDLPCATLPYEGLLDDLKAAGLLVDQGAHKRFVAVGYGETLNFPPPEPILGDGPRRFSFPEYRSLTKTQVLLNQNPAAGNSGIGAGDSGGPLFWVAPDGGLVLVGNHRATDLQRIALAFAYRADVPQSLDFINQVIVMVEAGWFG
jgi:hypothetical protein